MLRIGLTGGIGSGKTTVANIFRILGVPVFDSDTEAKQLYVSDPELKDAVIALFGQDTYRDGVLDRSRLASMVFNSPEKTRQLNELVHPLVQKKFEEWVLQKTSTYVIKEAALLIESRSYLNLDEMILVTAPESLRMRRAMFRDGSTETQIIERMQRQLSDEEKRRYCQHEIINDDHTLLIPQVLTLHTKWNIKSALD